MKMLQDNAFEQIIGGTAAAMGLVPTRMRKPKKHHKKAKKVKADGLVTVAPVAAVAAVAAV